MELKQIKEELEDIKEINEIVDNFQEFSELHDKEFLKQVYPQDIPFKLALMNSRIKEKNEISERLRGLSYNLSVLRSSILTKDHKNTLKIINDFLKNDYSGVSAITDELNDFKEKINRLDSYYNILMNQMPKTLDHKLTTEQKQKGYINKLHSLHQKQKKIFINTSKLFTELSKNSIKIMKKS